MSFVGVVLAGFCAMSQGIDLTVHVVDVDEAQGMIRALLRPLDQKEAPLHLSSLAQTPCTGLIAEGIPDGSYRLSVWQDLDQDATLDSGEPESPLDDASGIIFLSSPATSCRVSLKSGMSKGQDLAVDVKGFRNDRGWTRIALFKTPNGFPNSSDLAWSTGSVRIRSKAARLIFHGVSPGTMAIGVLHDEDEDGKMDTSLLGVPKEGHGASNNARGKLGPPSFQDAHFGMQGEGLNVSINLSY